IGIQVLQRRRIPDDASPAGVVVQVLGGGFSERPLRSDSIDRRGSNLLEPAREIPLCFVIVARSSALANASIPRDALIDLPFEAAVGTDSFVEAWHFSSRHSRPSSRVGRPLRRQYSSVHASSSSRSKAIARFPSGISCTDGRTRRLKLFLFMPRYAAASGGRRSRGEIDESSSVTRPPCDACRRGYPVAAYRAALRRACTSECLLDRMSQPCPTRDSELRCRDLLLSPRGLIRVVPPEEASQKPDAREPRRLAAPGNPARRGTGIVPTQIRGTSVVRSQATALLEPRAPLRYPHQIDWLGGQRIGPG